MTDKGRLIVISAPSGTGKTSLIRSVRQQGYPLAFSVSTTTRKMRKGEIDGKDYDFVSESTFRSMVTENEFLEWAKVHGNYYGTSRSRVMELVNDGVDVLLDIDVQGARQVRESFPAAILIFLVPPTFRELKRRLLSRHSDSPEDIVTRLNNAHGELQCYELFDYVIINDTLQRAASELIDLLQGNDIDEDRKAAVVKGVLSSFPDQGGPS